MRKYNLKSRTHCATSLIRHASHGTHAIIKVALITLRALDIPVNDFAFELANITIPVIQLLSSLLRVTVNAISTRKQKNKKNKKMT